MAELESEALRRKGALRMELEKARFWALASSYVNHYISLGLMVGALGCSVAAGALGFFTHVSPKIIGGLGALPPLIAYIARNLKCEGKNSWHARRADGLGRLRSQLIYEQPAEPTLGQVALIASGKTTLEEEMQAEWDASLLFDWTGFGHAKAENAAKQPRKLKKKI